MHRGPSSRRRERTSLESWTVETGFRKPGWGAEGGPLPGTGVAGRLALTWCLAWCLGTPLAAWGRPGLGPTSWLDNHSPLFKNSFFPSTIYGESPNSLTWCARCVQVSLAWGLKCSHFLQWLIMTRCWMAGRGAGPQVLCPFSTSVLLFVSSSSVSCLLRGNHGGEWPQKIQSCLPLDSVSFQGGLMLQFSFDLAVELNTSGHSFCFSHSHVFKPTHNHRLSDWKAPYRSLS